jgi:undecaprenyl-diphosphatase
VLGNPSHKNQDLPEKGQDIHTQQALIFALLQGATELAPVSSLGHGILLPAILGWKSLQMHKDFLPFMVALHLGTALALLLYFYRDWTSLCLGFLRRITTSKSQLRKEDSDNSRILLLVMGASIPGGLLGFLLEKKIRVLFQSPKTAAIFLIANGLVLFGGELLKSRKTGMPLHDLPMGRAILVGLFQAVALIPGFSRSGITMVGGILNGLGHEEAARFSFLLATPIILGAGVLEIPKMLKDHSPQMLHLSLIGAIVSFLTAWITTFFLMKYFRSFETSKALVPFGIYCLLVGVGAYISLS